LIDDNPDVQKRVERGRAEARLEGLREAALASIKSRFPMLITQVRQQIEQVQNVDAQKKLLLQLVSAATEDEVRKLLQSRKGSRKRKS
jgi:hypothetical protein